MRCQNFTHSAVLQIKELRAQYVDVVWELDEPPVETIQQLRIPQVSSQKGYTYQVG
jgi:hypothetical protein